MWLFQSSYNLLLDLRRSLLSFNEWYKYQTYICINWDTIFNSWLFQSTQCHSSTSFRDYFNPHSVASLVHQALIVQLCCLYRLKVQCSCLYVCIWQRMSSINNTSIRTYKKSNIIQDLYHSIFDFCYLSFCKIFCVFNTHSKVCIHYYVHSIHV